MQNRFHVGPVAPYWLFMLGALFILVTLLLPKGHRRTFTAWRESRKEHKAANAESARSRRRRRRTEAGGVSA